MTIEYLDANCVVGEILDHDVYTSPGVKQEIETLAKYGKINKKNLEHIKRAKIPNGAGMELFNLKRQAMEVSKTYRNQSKEPLSKEDAGFIAYALVLRNRGQEIDFQSKDKLVVDTYNAMLKDAQESEEKAYV